MYIETMRKTDLFETRRTLNSLYNDINYFENPIDKKMQAKLLADIMECLSKIDNFITDEQLEAVCCVYGLRSFIKYH